MNYLSLIKRSIRYFTKPQCNLNLKTRVNFERTRVNFERTQTVLCSWKKNAVILNINNNEMNCTFKRVSQKSLCKGSGLLLGL